MLQKFYLNTLETVLIISDEKSPRIVRGVKLNVWDRRNRYPSITRKILGILEFEMFDL